DNIKKRTSQNWELKNIQISHNLIEYHSFDKIRTANDTNCVRLHFGLQGSYDFSFTQLNSSYSLSGHHNNIMYSDGFEIEVQNKSKRVETFGINFNTDTFIEIGQNGNEPLKRFTDKIMSRKNAILSNEWKTNNFKIQQVINEIINCSYKDQLKDLFLLSKSIELLVLQAETYEQAAQNQFIKTKKDKEKLIEAKELLTNSIDNPPTIVELSTLTGINEYKLKKGFKELFGTTIFGYIHGIRMSMAKRLLLGTDKTAQEISYQTGYSSPQHFSKAFKNTFGVSPNSIRNNPDTAMKDIDNAASLDFN
ncbi:AraC family transcriptional regulator, partial [Sinomicrobium sp. 2019215]|uniref:helix-turn-helix transcriptional regulator n=1 Tax=Sinomicrobium weinanense TaxID=2842200 RepID=UPI001C0BE131